MSGSQAVQAIRIFAPPFETSRAPLEAARGEVGEAPLLFAPDAARQALSAGDKDLRYPIDWPACMPSFHIQPNPEGCNLTPRWGCPWQR